MGSNHRQAQAPARRLGAHTLPYCGIKPHKRRILQRHNAPGLTPIQRHSRIQPRVDVPKRLFGRRRGRRVRRGDDRRHGGVGGRRRPCGCAQGRLEAEYVASIAGIPIGRGNWVIEIADDQYTAAASGTTTGILRLFTGARGTGAARGTMVGGQPVPTSYAATINYDRKIDDVRIALAGGNVKDYSVEPPLPPHPDRIPVTDADRRGVIDPMTSALNRVGGTGDPVSPEACNRKVAVFDGRVRYDLHSEFRRMEIGQGGEGLPGPGGRLRGLFHADLRLRAGSARDQIPGRRCATPRSGWRRFPARGCWCRSVSRCRRRSAWACCRRRNSSPSRSRRMRLRKRSDLATPATAFRHRMVDAARPRRLLGSGCPRYPQEHCS